MYRRDRNTDHFCHMISGYLLVDEVEDVPGDEEEDDLEEEEDIQFLNYQEMTGVGQGKHLYEGRKMKCCKGTLKDFNKPNASERVAAPFHFIDSWWKICILRTRVIDHHRCPKDNTTLTYEIRKDDKVVQDKLVTMFLTKKLKRGYNQNYSENQDNVPISMEHIDRFLKFIRENGIEKRLKFENLEELMSSYRDSLPDEGKFSGDIILSTLDSPEWACISKALKYPKLVTYLSQLLPMQFKAIMENPENDDLVKDLSRALDLNPWIFGFKKLLNKDFNLVGCEASLLAIQRSEVFNSLKQVHKDALVIYDFLKTDTKQHGHTQISLVKLRDKQKDECPEFDEALKFLKRNKIIKEIEIEHDSKICLQQLWNYERKISEGICALYKKYLEKPWNLDVDLNSDEFDSIRSDREQLMAAHMLLKYPIVVISGKGGCGKTTVVTKVLSSDSDRENNLNENEDEDFKYEMSSDEDGNSEDYMLSLTNKEDDQNAPKIIYTAPTGKAANLLGRRAKTTGYTLHQIIWSYRFFITKLKKMDDEAKWKFRLVKTLVVDECSMVAVSTFSTLLTILIENSQLCKIVLLGDIRQLPSIEPGNFLADVYKSLYVVKSSIELMTNHRSESKLIVENATAISQKNYPLFSTEHKFFHCEVPQTEDKRNDMHDTVVQRILAEESILEDDKRSQFITFTNKYCDWINEHACKFYNNHTTRNHKKRLDVRIKDKICLKKNGMVVVYEEGTDGRMDVKYLEGDFQPEEAADVMEMTLLSQTLNGAQTSNQTKNRTLSDSGETSRSKEKRTPASIRLCNGEIYFVQDEKISINNRGKQARYLKFSDEDPDAPREFWVNYKEVMQKCKIRHSWARTIHTFQGSECENIIYVVGFCPVQNWQHVYTAVTRGKKAVYIVGTKYHIRKSIMKDADKRDTTLHHQLQDMLPAKRIFDELVSDDKDICKPEINSKFSTHKFTVLKTPNIDVQTSTPVFIRNGFQTFLTPKLHDKMCDSTHAQVPSPDSQWSDYGDETYIEATQNNQVNEHSFDLMDSLEMTENSEVLGDLTAACELLEASMNQNNQQIAVESKSQNKKIGMSHSFLNNQSNNETKGNDSSTDSIIIDEFDSFLFPGSSPTKRNSEIDSQTTPKKQKLTQANNEVSPARRMFTQLTFK